MSIELPINVVQHLHVLRIKNNREIILFNGDNNAYIARIIALERRNAQAYISAQLSSTTLPQLKITLAMCMIASDKMDLVVQKSVELGVGRIIPVISERTQQITNDRLSKRQEHWQKIIISSTEQCGQNWLPIIDTPVNLLQLLGDNMDNQLKIILSPTRDNSAICSVNLRNLQNINDITLLVGPEGGFTENEVTKALEKQYVSLTIGENVLRAETAAIAGISMLQTLFGSFK